VLGDGARELPGERAEPREPTTVEKRTKTGVFTAGSWRNFALAISAIDA